MAIFKGIIFLFLALGFIITTLPFYWWSKWRRYRSRKFIGQIKAFYCNLVLKLFAIETNWKGYIPLKQKKIGDLLVANHLSYLDVLILAANHPSCFVTSVEMKNTLFLGMLCDVGGCLYVERRNKDKIEQEIKDISNALAAGLDVIIFPEATSTCGSTVERFKIPLFRAARECGARVIPITLNYQALNYRPICAHNRDLVFWYGKMRFASHLWKFLQQRRLNVEVSISKLIDSLRVNDPVELSIVAHKAVLSRYIPIKGNKVSFALNSE
ncbi:MAG: lysophospholipid acyltransferase family protein [Bdellovibrionota bacterium]